MFDSAQDWLTDNGFKTVVLAPQSASRRLTEHFPDRETSREAWRRYRKSYLQFRWDQYFERGLVSKEGKRGPTVYPHDRGSWCVLILDQADEVAGIVSCRLFDGKIVRDWVYARRILDEVEPSTADRYSKGIESFLGTSRLSLGACAEVSNWAVGARYFGSPVAMILFCAAGALCHVMGPHAALALASVTSGECAMLQSVGGKVLRDDTGKPLAPFYSPFYQRYVNWVELRSTDFQPKCGIDDLSVDRFLQSCRLYSLPPQRKDCSMSSLKLPPQRSLSKYR